MNEEIFERIRIAEMIKLYEDYMKQTPLLKRNELEWVLEDAEHRSIRFGFLGEKLVKISLYWSPSYIGEEMTEDFPEPVSKFPNNAKYEDLTFINLGSLALDKACEHTAIIPKL